MNLNATQSLGLAAGVLLAGIAIGYLAAGPSSAPAEHPTRAESAANHSPEPPASTMTSAPTAEKESTSASETGTDRAGALFAASAQKASWLRRNHDLYEILNRMDADDLKQAIETVGKSRDRQTLLPMILSRLAEIDGAAAAQYALAETDQQIRSQVINEVVGTWARLDPDAAMAWVARLSTDGDRFSAANSAVNAIAASDPAAALRFANTMVAQGTMRNGYYYSLYYSVFRELAARNPAEAAKQAMAMPLLPNSSAREGALAAAAECVAQSDPQAALNLAKAINDPNQRRGAVSQVLSVWGTNDSAAVVAYLQAMPPGNDRNSAVSQLVSHFSSRDVDSARGIVDLIPPGEMRTRAMESLVREWGTHDPAAAAEYAATMPSGQARRWALEDVARRWAFRDVTAALAWAGQIPGASDEQAVAQGTIVGQWAQSDPKAAADYWSKQGENKGDASRSTMITIVDHWLDSDWQAANGWVRKMPEGALRDAAWVELMSREANTDPKMAVRDFDQLSSENQVTMAADIARKWVASDPTAAAGWAAGLPEGQVRERAYESLAHQWADSDPVKAAQWLETIPSGAPHDAAVDGFIRRVVDADPAGAAAWAGTIDDANRRRGTLDSVARRWLGADPAAAKAWINGTPLLDAAAKKSLLGQK